MHDRDGKELKVGDTVLLPATVTQLHATEDFCNVQLASLYGRRPDGAKETVYAINTAVLLRAEPGDVLDI